MECVTEKKEAVSLFFIKETANVCPSLHPYCIDWFFTFAEKGKHLIRRGER